MKRILLIVLTLLTSSLNLFAQNIDSLAKVALTQAAQNDVAALRPLYETSGKLFPHHIQLYCEMTLSRNEGEYEKMITCIDSLRTWYPKQIERKTLLSLSELKAEGLRQIGKYDELYNYCEKEIKAFKKKGIPTSWLKEIQSYKNKAQHLRGNSLRSALLQKADRYLVHELDSLFQKNKENVDEFAQLRCKFTLAHAFHLSDELLQSSRLLLEKYADDLDLEELSACIKGHADELIHQGNWEALKTWAQFAQSLNRNHTVPLSLYLALSEAFENKPSYELCRPKYDCSIQSTYEWPILFKAEVNGLTNVDFTLSSEQPYTLLSEEIAQKCKAEILPDTVLFSSPHGVMEVSPAWVEKITIGEIVFKNVYVYVIHTKSNISSPFGCAIGLNDLMALKKIQFLPEKICFPCPDDLPSTQHGAKSLYLTRGNNLRLTANYNHQVVSFNMDFSYPNNIIYEADSAFKANEEILTVGINGQDYNIVQPLQVNAHSHNGNGLLGIPFIRNYYSCLFDFSNMSFCADGEMGYQPSRGNFGHYTDKNYLLRNLNALEFGNFDDNEVPFLHQLIAIGKNDPASVIKLCEEMRQNENDFYDAHIEAENLCLVGKYKEACHLLQEIIKQNHPKLKENEILHLQTFLEKVRLYQNEYPSEAIGTSVSFDENEEGHTVRIHNKKISAKFDLFRPMTEISEKSAKKYKVRKLGQINHTVYGIIPLIDCGTLTLKNVPCIIKTVNKHQHLNLPDHGKGIILGWNILRLFKGVNFTPSKITYTLEPVNKPTKGARLYHDLSQWYVETETDGTFPTYRLSQGQKNFGISQSLSIAQLKIPATDIQTNDLDGKDESQGEISLRYLLTKTQKVTINLEKMEISF